MTAGTVNGENEDMGEPRSGEHTRAVRVGDKVRVVGVGGAQREVQQVAGIAAVANVADGAVEARSAICARGAIHCCSSVR